MIIPDRELPDNSHYCPAYYQRENDRFFVVDSSTGHFRILIFDPQTDTWSEE